MESTAARDELKVLLDIDSSIKDFDAAIDLYIERAVGRFAPHVYQEAAPQVVDVNPSMGQTTIDISTLPVSLDDVRKIEALFGAPVSEYSLHGSQLVIRDLMDNTKQVTLYGLKAYSLSTVPAHLTTAVFYFAQSMFYTFLMANKAKYNVYMQNGRAAVDDMSDLVDFFEQKGVEFLRENSTPYGR